MECSLQDRIRNGIHKAVSADLAQSNYFKFEKKSNIYIPYTQYTKEEITDKILDINTSYGSSDIVRPIKNGYKIFISDTIVSAYENIGSEKGRNVMKLMKKYNVNTDLHKHDINLDTFFSAIHQPEISEFTYEKLVSFLKSINPNLIIEDEIDNLSENAVSFIKEFVIGIRTGQRLKAMPEEVAHFFVELLPEDSQLKRDMISNITSFEIYSQVYKQYKDVYVNSDGTPNVNKIKKEAAGKLIGEYITAISTNNFERVNKLVKVKEGWLRKWLRELLEFFNIKIMSHPDYKIYSQGAFDILTGEASEEFKSNAQQRLQNETITDSYFFMLTEQAYGRRYSEYATSIEQKARDRDKIPELIETFSKFNNSFNQILKNIEKDKNLVNLNEALKSKNKGITTSDVSILVQIQEELKSAKIQFSDFLGSQNIVKGMYSFLVAIDKLNLLSNELYNIVKDKEKAKDFNEALNNVNELYAYSRLYEYMQNLLDKEFTEQLQGIGVGIDIINNIKDTTSKFDTVTKYILSRQREQFSPILSELLAFTRDKVGKKLQEDLKRETDRGAPKGVIDDINRQIEEFVQTDEKINKFLLGMGRDVDLLEQVGFWANAAISNGDIYVSSIVSFIQNKIKENQSIFVDKANTLYERLATTGLRENTVEIGKSISYISKKYDPLSEDGSPLEVVTFLGAVKYNEYNLEERQKREIVREKKEAFDRATTDSEKDIARKEWTDAKEDLNLFISRYKFREFTSEYYEVFDKYSKNPAFVEQYTRWQELKKDIAALRFSLNGATLENAKETEIEIAYAKREQGNLLSDIDLNGNVKSEEEIEKAKLLKDYFTESSKFREYDSEKSNQQYEIAKTAYILNVEEILNELLSKDLTVDDFEKRVKEALKLARFDIDPIERKRKVTQDDVDNAVIDLKTRWEEAHERIVIKQSYYDKQKELYEKINQIKRSASETRITDLYSLITELTRGTRDEIGEINPDGLSSEELQKIIDTEKEIYELRSQRRVETIPAFEFYSEEDAQDILDLYEELYSEATTPRRAIKITSLIRSIQNKYRKIPEVKAINDLYKEIQEMKTSVPTEYYWDKMDELLVAISEYSTGFISKQAQSNPQNLELSKFSNELENLIYIMKDLVAFRDFDSVQFSLFAPAGPQEGTKLSNTFDIILNGEASSNIPSLLEALDGQPEYTSTIEWFNSSHIKDVSVFDPSAGERGKKVKVAFVPSKIYKKTVPTDPNDFDIRVSSKFSITRVKDEFRTGYNPNTEKVELKVGYHIDNRGQFLPLPKEENPYDNKFINEDYYTLRSSDPKRFDYLNILTERYLEDQELLPERMRRYLDVPVASLTSQEDWKRIGTTLKEKGEAVQSFFKVRGEDVQSAVLSRQEEGVANIMDYDGFTGDLLTEVMPKLGMSTRIKPEFVSRDLVRSVLTFGEKAGDFAARSERLPVVQSLIKVLSTGQKGSGNKNRIELLKKVFEKDILKTVPDTLINNKHITDVTRLLTKSAALRLVLNPIGGTINYIGATTNNLIEAFAGKYINWKEYSKGSYDAAVMTKHLIMDYGKSDDLSYWTLLYQKFDFVQGDFLDDILDRSSLSNKLFQVQQLMMTPMKAGEIKTQSSMALGILHRAKVKDKNGKEYPFHQIYEKKGNKLVLKEGFDEELYNPTNGKEFLRIRNVIHKINLELHGNYAKINATELSRYSVGKLAENLKKWFVPMFQRRFGREGIDIITEEMDGGGYYRTAMKLVWQIVKHAVKLDFKGAGGWIKYYWETERYRKNLNRTGFDLLFAFASYIIYALLLGYSGDDKNKEIKENGYFHNMAILIFLRANAEQTSFIPYTTLGLQELKRNLLSPWSLQSDTVSNWFGLGHLAILHIGELFGADFDKELYYQKNTGYPYAEKGDPRIYKYALRTIGYTGYTFTPAPYIKDFSILQGRIK
jgi:hypothetical protein